MTAEVSPHHLSLTDEAALGYDTNTKVAPPLRSAADVQACRAGLADGTLDAIATDHAPHALHEKDLDFVEAPPGLIGFETAVAVVLDLVRQNEISPLELVRRLSTNPARILNRPGRGSAWARRATSRSSTPSVAGSTIPRRATPRAAIRPGRANLSKDAWSRRSWTVAWSTTSTAASWFHDPSRNAARPAILALADGTVYRGQAFGAPVVGVGEVVFNTSMTGYQEILTDPSYAGQIVAMTYPQIGNVGVNPEDEESVRPFLQGFVVKEIFERPSNWRSRESLDAYLRRHAIPGIAGIDTRALVRRIREGGAQVGCPVRRPGTAGRRGTGGARAQRARPRRPRPGGRGDLRAALPWNEGPVGGRRRAAAAGGPRGAHLPPRRLRLRDQAQHRRQLVENGFDVTVVPARPPPRRRWR